MIELSSPDRADFTWPSFWEFFCFYW